IHRWDKWLNHSLYQEKYDKINALMLQNIDFGAIFAQATEQYLTRYCTRLDNMAHFDWDRAKKICLEYLMEECAVLCLWPELNCHFEIYPNRHNDAMEATRQYFITPHYPNLLKAIHIGFRKAKQLKPQTFELMTE
ncbi:MAG: hypothetical protein ACK4PR_04385, partial [Gammaproteobacteria bacterium]